MSQKLRTRSALGLVAIAAAAALAMLFAASSSHATVATHAVTPALNGIGGRPMMSGPQQMTSNATFGCQTRPMDGSHGPRCYQAKQIQNAYNYSGLLAAGIDGRGKTITIIDAYGSPTIQTDLQTFDSVMGLPNPPSFQVITPAGSPPPFDVNDPNQFGWSVETTLDVEWAHAMAPGANIVLDVAASNNDSDILNATQYVIQHRVGDVISQSFGEAEACMDSGLLAQQHALFAQARAQGQTVFASSGDSGASQPACTGDGALFAVSTPASDPNVTGVGGTTLTADTSTGAYIGETAWTEPFGCNPPAIAPSDVNCSGGGFSSVYNRPSWQTDHSSARGVPDVAYNAGVSGGVLIYSATINAAFGFPPNALVFFIIGGTSAGSPQWAALTADADQLAHHDLGLINDNLYGLGQDDQGGPQKPLHDITTGNNDVAEIGGGYNASRGWDPVTGLGTPNAALLLPALANTQNQQ
jgi:subtilase family serine protease